MSIIGSLPFTIANGQLIDATPVQNNFNWIVNQVNANAAPVGGLTTIASGSMPAAPTQVFTDIPQTYQALYLQLTGVSSDTASREPLVRVSANNGVSYDSTASGYAGNSISAGVLSQTTLASLIESAAAGAAAETWNATIIITGYQQGPYTRYVSLVQGPSGTGVLYHVEGWYLSVAALNALQILLSGAGNFDAGTYALYGIN